MRSVRPVHILVESPDFHRLVVENTPDLISVHSSDGACLYVSPSSEATLGFTNEELTGADAFAHVHPDDRALLRETLRPELPAGAAPPTTFTTEIRCRHRKGHYVWLEIHGTRIAPEAPLDEQLAIFVSRHIASERLIHADQHEREIRRRFTPPYTDWYWEVDEDGRFTFFPEYEARAYGTPLLGVLGKTRQELADDPLSPGML
jgi:PAS domain S-box-containing protein